MSHWLKQALSTAMKRDPVKAANDADLLRAILFAWAAQLGSIEGPDSLDADSNDGSDHAA